MKKKLQYNAPEMEVVEVATEQTILDGSFNASRQSFGEAQADTWGEE